MDSTPLNWTCELCGTTVRWRQRRQHAQNNCPKQGLLKYELENPLPPIACHCGCQVMIPQSRRTRPKHYATQACYDRARGKRDRSTYVRRPPPPAAEEQATRALLMRERSLAMMAEKAAEAMKPPEDSHALWLRCLGLST
jgi:hypothetical protein